MPLMTWLSSEGRCHYNTEEGDYSNPIPVDYMMIPPTFITYNVQPIEKIDEQKVRETLSKIFEEKSESFISRIQLLVEEKMSADINMSIDEAIRQAFSELGAISNEEIDVIVENN